MAKCECGCGAEADREESGYGRFARVPGLSYNDECWSRFRNEGYNAGVGLEEMRSAYVTKCQLARGSVSNAAREEQQPQPVGLEPLGVLAWLPSDAKPDNKGAFIREQQKVIDGWFEAIGKQAAEALGYGGAEVDIVRPSLLPATCATCTSPATHGGRNGEVITHCVYCYKREQNPDELMRRIMDDPQAGIGRYEAARIRLAAADARDRRPVTATDRSLAGGHPKSWPSCEGEE